MFPDPEYPAERSLVASAGIVQLTIPYLLYSLAIRHVRALDASIISIIEPILNPIWVMLATSEHPSFWSIVGGLIVLATSLTRSLVASRNARALADSYEWCLPDPMTQLNDVLPCEVSD